MTLKHLLVALLLVAALGLAGIFYTSSSSSSGETSSPRETAQTSTTETKVDPKTEAPGILKGVVKFDGEPPEPKFTTVPPAMECPATVVDESLVIDKESKGLKWTIIRIMGVQPKDVFRKTTKRYQITQKGCAFSPHVVIVPPDTDLQILNPDKILHNVQTTPYDSKNLIANFATIKDETYKAEWLKEPELIEVKCDIHVWMKCFIVCHDPRYCAVSRADGTFEIKNLPAGKFKVNVWHESFGNYMQKETIDVEVKAGATTDMGELKFAPKK